MTFKELEQLAQPHIRKNGNLPSNAFLLLTQLHIQYKTEKQCEEDYHNKMNPLYNRPSFLAIDLNGNKTIYFNSKTRYWNFYIFHEIAHYILGHENNSTQNEIDADMLACILTAPIENLPSTIKSARDLSITCQIPIDKAEAYWAEIKHKFSKPIKTITIISCLCFLILIILHPLCLKSTIIFPNNTPTFTASVLGTQSKVSKNNYFNKEVFYITSSGTHYHKRKCQYVENKTNVIFLSSEDVINLNLLPCKKCIK